MSFTRVAGLGKIDLAILRLVRWCLINLLNCLRYFALLSRLSFQEAYRWLILMPVLVLLAVSCRTAVLELPSAGIQPITKSTPSPTNSSDVTLEPTAKSTEAAPPTLTPLPVHEEIPTPTTAATSTAAPSAVPMAECEQRVFDGDLLTVVTRDYGLGRDYEPTDLVRIADYLPPSVTLGYDTEVREVIIEPLVQLLADMIAEDLDPEVISGYRSYSAQAIAWEKWRQEEPDRVSIISAPPGYSEHQLGTTIDFGSPELEQIVGQDGVEFHTYFYQTKEGAWLIENAHRYGFTMSYPREAQEVTGFFYEPWHFRYVGAELATYLEEERTFLTAFLLEHLPEPCIP